MLEFTLNKHHTGLTLWGDYPALKCLYTLIHELVAQSRLIEDKEGFVLSLAYDVRKAMEGQRLKAWRQNLNDKTRIYGVQLLWPLILIQIGLLREAMAFLPTTKREQATLFEFEYVLEAAVRQALPVTADELWLRVRCAMIATYAELDLIIDSRCCYFLELPPAKRLAALDRVLETFDPMYLNFAYERDGQLRPGVIPPDSFAQGPCAWPAFKW